jgi:hypothetical protein
MTNYGRDILNTDNPSDERLFLSPIMRIPPTHLDEYYYGVCVFCIPRQLLCFGLTFYLIIRDIKKKSELLHLMPNTLTGYTEVTENLLTNLIVNKSKDYVKSPVTWYQESSLFYEMSDINAELEFNCYTVKFTDD